MDEQRKLFKDEQQKLFDEEERKKLESADLLAELQRNARNKIPPKPPIKDDDGDPIPF
jgi:hypothetical protein